MGLKKSKEDHGVKLERQKKLFFYSSEMNKLEWILKRATELDQLENYTGNGEIVQTGTFVKTIHITIDKYSYNKVSGKMFQIQIRKNGNWTAKEKTLLQKLGFGIENEFASK